jgi:rare lipoprotein A
MKTLLSLICLLLAFAGTSQVQTGKASFYADQFNGRPTASGEIYKHELSTAAHRKLPFGTKVKVTNLENNKTAIVKINDRGPFIRGRIIDLSKSVAESLDILQNGVSDVQIEVLDADAQVTKAEPSMVKEIDEEEKGIESPKQTTPTSENFQNTGKQNSEEREFYKLNVDRIEPDFYGVQIASFSESDNLLRLANNLKVSYKSEVTIQVKTINQTRVYTVILGQFKTRQEAERFRDNNLEKYPDAFIVDMTTKD